MALVVPLPFPNIELMVYYKTSEEIELIRQSCLLVSKSLALVASLLKPGVTGATIDKEAETLIRDHGATPGFKGYGGFPATLCISPNETVVHGIPSDRPFLEGEIVSVDCGVFMNGFFGDAAFTFAIGAIEEKVERLLSVTRTSLRIGVETAVAGNRLGDVGYAIQHYVEREQRMGIVRELVGHGIGRNLHEAPEVPNYGKRGSGIMMKEGLVLAIEPMVNLGRKEVRQGKDGWTINTRDGLPSAHYEHTVAVGKGAADVLSDHIIVETAVKNNSNLTYIGEYEISVG